jgi:hypothetical protein
MKNEQNSSAFKPLSMYKNDLLLMHGNISLPVTPSEGEN